MIENINSSDSPTIKVDLARSYEKIKEEPQKVSFDDDEACSYESQLQGYIYYKGERVSQAEFLHNAIKSGAIEYDETQPAFHNYEKAWKTLIEDKAKPLFDWSKTLYSEDGMYRFRVEDGIITGSTLARDSNGVLWKDMADELASGKYPYEVNGHVFDLIWGDSELYDAACNIGRAKRLYDEKTTKYQNGMIDYKEYINSLEPLCLILLGKTDSSSVNKIKDYYEQDKSSYIKTSFENYNPQIYKQAWKLT